MALKSKYQRKEEIPAEHAPFYLEHEGTWLLDVDGGEDRVALDRLRRDNAALGKQVEDFKKRFDGIDPDEVRRMTEENRSLRTATLSDDAKREMEAQVNAAKTGFDRQLAAVASERDALNARLMAIQIDQGVVAAATKRGLRATAMTDITARARSVFKLVNGVPMALDADGKTVRPGKDGVAGMTLEEWVDGQVAEAPHLFESNAGGGAAGSSSGGAGNGVRNPWRKETWNLTEQMKIQRADPKRADAMRMAAG